MQGWPLGLQVHAARRHQACSCLRSNILFFWVPHPTPLEHTHPAPSPRVHHQQTLTCQGYISRKEAL
jgi:hypothetical protein